MDDEAEAAREYDRLRAELADFVLNALAERVAAGQEPQLSQALIDAIERRVDEAVAARLAAVEWPDPDAFADSVIAAADGRGGERASGPSAGARRSERAGRRREPPPRERRLGAGQIALLAVIGILIVAAATYFFLRGWNTPAPDTFVRNVQTNTFEPLPSADANAQQPAGNAAAPTSAGAVQNLQGPSR